MEFFFFLLCLLIAIVFFIAAASRKSKPAISQGNYDKKPYLLTKAERSFYGVLIQAVGTEVVVFSMVRVADVLKTRKGMNPSDRQRAFNQISAKHFDFILCQPTDLSIISVIELDDSSHGSEKRIKRDNFLNSACSSAGLTLHRFPAQNAYSVSDIRKKLLGGELEEVESQK